MPQSSSDRSYLDANSQCPSMTDPMRPNLQLTRQPLSADECGWLPLTPDSNHNWWGEIVSATVNDVIAAEAVVQRTPDDAVSILFSGPDSPEVSQHLAAESGIEAILTEAAVATKREGLRYAYTFVRPERAEDFQNACRRTQFRVVDQILELTMPLAGLANPQEATEGLTFHHANVHNALNAMPLNETEWESLLLNIINKTQDLPDLPRPSPQQLHAMWTSMDRHVRASVAVLNRQPIGIAVLSSDESSPASAVIVEYFGIHSEHRRRGVARQLLGSAVQEFPFGQREALATFVAQRNAPAMAFFELQGFMRKNGQQLWVFQPE